MGVPCTSCYFWVVCGLLGIIFFGVVPTGVVLLFKGAKGYNDPRSVPAAMQRPTQACEWVR